MKSNVLFDSVIAMVFILIWTKSLSGVLGAQDLFLQKSVRFSFSAWKTQVGVKPEYALI